MIYDCIIYNGEKDLLEIRLNEMSLCNDWVTTVIVEANKTHTGWDKPFYFEQHKQEFARFNIFYLAIDYMPENVSAREMEAFQRNHILTALNFLQPKEDDIVLISDVDEIPRAKAVGMFKPDMQFASLMQDKYAYYLNNIEENSQWDRCRIMSAAYLRGKKPEDVRNSGYDIVLLKGGWHWSWVIDPVKKLQSFSHTELDTPENIERVERKENIWDDNKFKVIDIDLSHPEYLVKNIDKFKHLIR